MLVDSTMVKQAFLLGEAQTKNNKANNAKDGFALGIFAGFEKILSKMMVTLESNPMAGLPNLRFGVLLGLGAGLCH
jgi:hypothetical protein